MRKSLLLTIILSTVLLITACSSTATENPILKASGFIEGETYSIITLSGGRVENLAVEEGQDVRAGDILVQLDPESIRPQALAAQSGLDAAEAGLNLLEQEPTAVERTAAAAQVAAAEAASIAAQAELDILIDIYDPIDPPETILRSAEEQVSIADAGLALALSQRDLVLAGPGEYAITAAEASVREAEANLGYVEELLARQTLTAPVDGRVAVLLLQTGEFALPGAQVVQLLDPGNLTLTVFLPQDQLALVSIGDHVDVRVDSYPEDVFSAVVSSIAEEAQFTPSTVLTEEERVKLVFAVRIAIEDPDQLLHTGMPADAVFLP